MTDTATTDAPKAPEIIAPVVWAKVELMGHRTHSGIITEVEQFGVKMLRVDVFAKGEQPVSTHFYGGAAIYGLTKITEEQARNNESGEWRGHSGVPLQIGGPLVVPLAARCPECGVENGKPCLLDEKDRERCPVPF